MFITEVESCDYQSLHPFILSSIQNCPRTGVQLYFTQTLLKMTLAFIHILYMYSMHFTNNNPSERQAV
jgi:hypothetical protein